VFQLITDHPKAFIIDPVCRMIISDSANTVQHPEMAGILFCSDHCMDIYRRNKGIGDN
jgi:YHS domain-containing protein